MSEFVKESVINDLMIKIQKHKDDLVISKIKEIDPNFSIEDEKNRRFRRIMITLDENEGNKETYYFNDGSIEGKRLITFETINKNTLHNLDKPFSVSADIKHY